MTTFKRYELKYIITKSQAKDLKLLMKKYMKPDDFGKSVIHNIYYDTPDYKLIRRSIEKPTYKEKLRTRTYGSVNSSSPVFVELKKKYKGVVYKRRIKLEKNESESYLNQGEKLNNTSQISREIDYFKQIYSGLSPKVYLSYHREAFFGKVEKDLRITFDSGILYRTENLNFSCGEYGQGILNENQVILEIKLSQGMPLWLRTYLNDNQIYKTSFSKYGHAYLDICKTAQIDKLNVA